MNASNTVKQLAIRAAMEKHPRDEGESARHWADRIAPIVGASPGYIGSIQQTDKNLAIGAALRAKEEADAKLRCEVMPPGRDLGPVTNFHGWIDVFAKFKVLSEAYLNLARSRHDVYAVAFLQNIQEQAEHAQSRAAMSEYG